MRRAVLHAVLLALAGVAVSLGGWAAAGRLDAPTWSQLSRALDALLSRDSGLAESVICADEEINAMELTIDDVGLEAVFKRVFVNGHRERSKR